MIALLPQISTHAASDVHRPMSLLLALSDFEKNSFLSQVETLRLASLPVKSRAVPPHLLLPRGQHTSPPAQVAEWESLFVETQPEILLGGWAMPPLTSEILRQCPRLRYICYVAGSVRNKVPRDFLERGGILSNWGNVAAPTVAECALMLALMGLRQATRFALELHGDRIWRNPSGASPLSLYRRRVGIHGFGHVTRALLPLLRPFEAHIEAWSDPVPAEVFSASGVRQAKSLAALYRENDVVIVTEALTPQTRNSVDRDILGGLRPGSVLVNVARGAIIEESSLIELARQGEVQIGLDVYPREPLPTDSPLRGLRNVTLLPHTAGPTVDWYPICGRRALGNLESYLEGKQPPDALSLERYDLST